MKSGSQQTYNYAITEKFYYVIINCINTFCSYKKYLLLLRFLTNVTCILNRRSFVTTFAVT